MNFTSRTNSTGPLAPGDFVHIFVRTGNVGKCVRGWLSSES